MERASLTESSNMFNQESDVFIRTITHKSLVSNNMLNNLYRGSGCILRGVPRGDVVLISDFSKSQ